MKRMGKRAPGVALVGGCSIAMNLVLWRGWRLLPSILSLFAVACLGLSLVGCGGAGGSAGGGPKIAAEKPIYRLGSGDKLRVTVFDEPRLSGDFEVSDQGALALPLIGEVKIGGMTTKEAEKLITAKYTEKYLKNPWVSIEVASYRPFFIVGEVRNPGSFPYVSGMTALNAVALAGGYTPRADRGNITIKRGADPAADEERIGEFTNVMPGDIVRVNHRFF